MRDFQLYVILDTQVCSDYGDIIETASALIQSGCCDILQLRAKKQSTCDIINTGQRIKRLIKNKNPLFIINDSVQAADILDADGVHLGQDDLPVKDARRILGKDKIIGLSTHNLSQALEAEQQGADYIAIGPIFATATKPGIAAISPNVIARLKDNVKIPFVAIGGINLDNVQEVIGYGASRIAVCRAVLAADNTVDMLKQFRKILSRGDSM
ncbi:MAG: thiamine phosphate synthase [Candidatus Omnitrophota bacterium]